VQTLDMRDGRWEKGVQKRRKKLERTVLGEGNSRRRGKRVFNCSGCGRTRGLRGEGGIEKKSEISSVPKERKENILPCQKLALLC